MGQSLQPCALTFHAAPLGFARQNSGVASVEDIDFARSMTDPFSDAMKGKYLEAATTMRVLHFPMLKLLGRIPHSSEGATVPYSTVPRERVAVIFVSHRWLSPSGSLSWPTGDPDDDRNSKFMTLVGAVQKLPDMLRPGLSEGQIFLWIDFCCIDQTQVAAGQTPIGIFALDYFIQQSDAILTPVVDDDTSWSSAQSICGRGKNIFDAYGAKAWAEYWSRGWCRLEAFLAAALPLDERSQSVFAARALEKKRPHLLYGTLEFESFSGGKLWTLPALSGKFFDKYDPAEGTVSKESDKETLLLFRGKVLKYLARFEADPYTGKVDENGVPHGKGQMVEPDYTIYDGEFVHGKREGNASVFYANGVVFHGEYRNDMRCGQGSEMWPNGTLKYKGMYKSGKRHGLGILYSEEGKILHEGMFPEPASMNLHGKTGIFLQAKEADVSGSASCSAFTSDAFLQSRYGFELPKSPRMSRPLHGSKHRAVVPTIVIKH